MVERPGEQAAVWRAKWLAELSEALDEVQRLLPRLGLIGTGSRESIELYLWSKMRDSPRRRCSCAD